ncbi:hypothetical protein [Streptomyces melanogenes]|uniref:Uncharacterized protein n=1 Tax=Streptomyces melanogenes TaxID=67326 RepID=A0ABZ1XED4_9ACTN|nr:hypothetical protein [Streptomyces melanogenes]
MTFVDAAERPVRGPGGRPPNGRGRGLSGPDGGVIGERMRRQRP